MQATVLIGLGLLSALMLLSALGALRSPLTVGDFFLMSHRLELKKFATTLTATNLSLGNFIFLAAIWGFSYGFGGIFWLVVAVFVFVIVYTKIAPNFREFIEDGSNTGTLHEYLASRFMSQNTRGRRVQSRSLRLVASLATVITLAIALALELYLAANLLSPWIHVEPGFLFLVLTLLISFYSATGGYWSVVFTDLLQALVMLIGVLAAIAIIIANPHDMHMATDSVSTILFSIGWANIMSILVMGIGWFLVTMDTWQRASATRSLDTSVKGTTIGGIIMGFVIVFWSFIGMYDQSVLSSVLDPSVFSRGYNPLSDFLIAGSAHGVLDGLFLLGLVMAGLSTADTFLIVASHSLVSDVMIGVVKRAKFGDLTEAQAHAFTGIGRAVVIFLAIIVIAVWMLLSRLGILGNALSLFFVAYSVQFALLPAVLLSLNKSPGSPLAAILGIVGGILVALFVGITSAQSLASLSESLWGLTPDKWLALTPVVTVMSAAVIHLVARKVVSSLLLRAST